jgi:hypothetical protein
MTRLASRLRGRTGHIQSRHSNSGSSAREFPPNCRAFFWRDVSLVKKACVIDFHAVIICWELNSMHVFVAGIPA